MRRTLCGLTLLLLLTPGARADASDTFTLGGVFEDDVDFDRGPDELLGRSAGGWDVVVASYEDGGEVRNVWTWGGKGSDQLGNSALAFDS